MKKINFIESLDTEFSPDNYSVSYFLYNDKIQNFFNNHWTGRSLNFQADHVIVLEYSSLYNKILCSNEE